MKQTFKTIYASAVVAAMVLTATPVAAKKKAKASIKSVTLSNLPAKTLTLKKGKSKKLKFKVKTKGKISKALAYKTSNKKIATVSKKGVVKAKKKGKAKITAYAKKNKKKKVVVTVTVGTPVTKVKLKKTKVTIYKGKKYTLKATISPKKASNKKVLWKTSNKKIAKVTSKGKVTAVKAGKAKITATAADGSGKKATATITVKNKKKAAPKVVATAATAATVQDPRNVQLTLNKAQALDKSQITVQSKSSEAANFHVTDEIKSISTTDNVNYTIFLKSGSAIDDDENVRVTVTGLANNPAASVVETYYSGLVTSKSDEQTIALKKGSRTSTRLFDNAYSKSDYYKYEVTSGALPAGMSRDEKDFGTYTIFGSPTANSDITIKQTSPHGDTVTKTIHFKVYDKDSVALSGTNTYNWTKDVDTKGTDTVADDTLSNVSVNVDLSASGAQEYRPEYEYRNNATGAIISSKDYYTQETNAGEAAAKAESDKYAELDGEDIYYLKDDAEEKQAPKTYNLDDYEKETGTIKDNETNKDVEVYIKKNATALDKEGEDTVKVTVKVQDDQSNTKTDDTNKDATNTEETSGKTDTTENTETKDAKADDTKTTVKIYNKSDVVTKDTVDQAQKDADQFANDYYVIDDTHAVLKEKTFDFEQRMDKLNAARTKAENDFDAQYTEIDPEYTHYEIVGDAHGLKIDEGGNVTGELAGSASITVKATRKNTAGADVSDTTTLNFNIADTKLIKGTVTDLNGKAVPGAGISFDNRKADSPYGGAYATTNAQGQYAVAVENSTYNVTTYANQSDTFTKDVALNADNNAYNLALDGVAVTLAPSDPSVYPGGDTLYDDNNYAYTIQRVASDTDNNGNFDHTDGYIVVLENGTTYNLASPDEGYGYFYSETPTNGYNLSVSNLTINGNATTSAVLNVNKK